MAISQFSTNYAQFQNPISIIKFMLDSNIDELVAQFDIIELKLQLKLGFEL